VWVLKATQDYYKLGFAKTLGDSLRSLDTAKPQPLGRLFRSTVA